MELLRIQRNKKVKQKHKSNIWKWGPAFYIMAWPFAIAQLLTFIFVVSDDQLCATGVKHGFNTWRSVAVINQTFISPIVLIFEYTFNQLIFKTRHIVLPISAFFLYLGVASFISWLLKGEAPYPGNFSIIPFKNSIDWQKQILEK